MRHCPPHILHVSLVACLAGCLFGQMNSLKAATVIYTETFPNATAGNLALNSTGINWQAYTGNTATNGSSNTTTSTGFVVSNGSGSDGSAGFVQKGSATGKGISYTSDFTPVNRSSTEISSFSFSLNNTNTTDAFFVAIQLNVSGTPTWYVSTQGFTATTALTWETKTLTFSTLAAGWRSLTMDPGVSLNVGSVLAAPLPMGNLTAAGLYVTNGAVTGGGATGNTRFDTFEMAVVPEPSSIVLGLLGVGMLIFRRKLVGLDG